MLENIIFNIFIFWAKFWFPAVILIMCIWGTASAFEDEISSLRKFLRKKFVRVQS